MKRPIYLSFILLLATITACNSGRQDIEKLRWLEGSWMVKGSMPPTYESWERINETEMKGRSWFEDSTGPVNTESIRLKAEGGSVIYEASVSDQNGGIGIPFQMQAVQHDTFSFVNEKHDFPQMIRYIKTSDTSFTAEVGKTEEGKWAGFRLFFIRMR
jgi:hypothetical protein